MSDVNDLFEKEAAEFYSKTGLIAPGKSVGMAAVSGKTVSVYRRGAWDVWKKLKTQLAEAEKMSEARRVALMHCYCEWLGENYCRCQECQQESHSPETVDHDSDCPIPKLIAKEKS